MNNGKNGKGKLTGLILATLMCTGGYCISPAYAGNAIVHEGDTAVNVYNGEITNTSVWESNSTGPQSGHTATIEGTVTGDVFGGYSSDGEASNNAVIIGKVGGPQVTVSTVKGGQGATEASNNTVTIQGNTVFNGAYASVYGGVAYAFDVEGNSIGIANNNTVNILSAISIPGALEGGQSEGGTSTGNTLNISASGVTVGSEGLRAFQNLNFYLPTNITTNDTMLTVNGEANVTNAKIGVLAQGTLASLVKNNKVTLLSATTLTGGSTISQTTDISVPSSITTVNTYEFSVATESNNIVATLTNDGSSDSGSGSSDSGSGSSDSGSGSSDSGSGSGSSGAIIDSETAKANAKSVVETRAATTTFINAGADMLASQGFAQAANAVALDTAQQQQSNGGAPEVSSFTPYAALGGSSMRAESGSHVDTKGFGLNVGFAREIANSQGKLLFGPLVEYGGGKYDSYLDNGTHGDGGSHYWGIGLMARQINHDGFYYEGSLRGGRVNSDYNGGFNNQTVKYDSTSSYFAAHVGLGKVKSIGHNNTLDGYMKYFFSHQGGDNVTMHGSVSGDESWSFDSVNSHRLRLGARLTHRINDRNSFYGGLAYQYEFGGEATAHYNGGSTPSPSVKGGSGMLELGWQVKPGGPVSIDFGVTGWIGKQRGGSVQLGATWSF
ncbi:autotransporter outer membrane beta-barrel domain-containing protein [uncultured Anaerovibrio sp.]|uniref:autotransporter outer membrane beta-barrel domain-containing protein n=1 Tax=uncultured Anaerovibrio sp. TaxID=361586 RepID=UPI0026330080|nr:autotransporter outer membrane beta-barrel domain-containing protein [uncultured Anaerovibrio sp.]